MRISEFFKDQSGSNSISRAIPAVVIAWILVLASIVTIKTGALADIPPGWHEIFTTAMGFYAVSKAREVFAVFSKQQEGGTDASQQS